MTFNYDPPSSIRTTYNWKWDTDSVQYLGRKRGDFSKLYDINYGPLISKIKSDIQRWNVIPFLSLSSRIDSIRMNILPRMLYLFQSLPLKIPPKQFLEWDRLIARYLWQGKKARIKFKMLQLKKDKSGLGLFTRILSCCPTETLNLFMLTKLQCSMEGYRRNNGIPITAALSDNTLLVKATDSRRLHNG